MGANHADKGIIWVLRLKKMRSRKLGMIGNWICSANFKLNPKFFAILFSF
jgi:hypothetical protein